MRQLNSSFFSAIKHCRKARNDCWEQRWENGIIYMSFLLAIEENIQEEEE